MILCITVHIYMVSRYTVRVCKHLVSIASIQFPWFVISCVVSSVSYYGDVIIYFYFP